MSMMRCRIHKTTIALLLGLLSCFAQIAQAQTMAGPVQAPGNAAPFDHSKTGFLLRDIHTTLRCEQCHVDGIFKNTPKDCGGCHAIGSRVGATPKPVNHVQTTQSCDTCHTSPTSFLVKSFNHVGMTNVAITNGCITCHNGQSFGVVSKPANHFPTLLPCESCHTSTNTFLSWRMDHTGLTSNCASCHSGQFPGVVSKPVAHIATTADCGVCHNTSTFLGSTYNHSTVVAGTCGTCHLGQQPGVKAQPAFHIPTLGAGNACDACHTATNTGGFTSFLGALYDHITPLSAGNCSTCHNGAYPGVLGKSSYALHVTTSAQCDTCHTSSNTSNFTTFLGVVYAHQPADVGNCSTCHNGTTATGKPANHVASAAQCDTCHTSATTANYTTWLGATVAHTAAFLGTSTCASCHNGVSATGKPAYHIPTTAGLDCGNSSCHTATNTSNYTTFFGATFTHVTITTRCDACHNGVSATGKSATHVSTVLDCVSCHTATNTANYTTFLGAVYTHNPNPPTPGTCASCHNGTTATGKPANHMVTTASCDACHTQANTGNFTTFLGATGAMAHTAAMAGTCASCHNGAGAKGLSTGHIPVAALSCDGCHAMYNGTTVTTFAPGTMNHALVTATRCDVCHGGAYTTQGLQYGGAQAKVSNHIPTTITAGLDCTTCHTSPTYTSSTGWLQEKMNHNNAQGGGGGGVYCVNCHLSGVTYLGSMQKKSHNGASTAKDCSSSSCHKPLGRTGTAYTVW